MVVDLGRPVEVQVKNCLEEPVEVLAPSSVSIAPGSAAAVHLPDAKPILGIPQVQTTALKLRIGEDEAVARPCSQ